jgi:hypothetical protein
MTSDFNQWWNDELSPGNPYSKDTAIWWAWEGWQAATSHIAKWIESQRNDIPATGGEFAAALRQQEPVAWLIPGAITRDPALALANGQNAEPLYREPQPAPAPAGWQPIETAPKDRTHVLVAPGTWGSKDASIAYWDADKYSKSQRPYWRRTDDYGRVTISREKQPTHWMPLPAAPQKKEGE